MDNTPNRLQTLLAKRGLQWFLLMAAFFGTVAVLFVSNDRFSSDFYSYLTFPPQTHKAIDTSVRVTIDFGNGKKRAFEGSIASPITAGQALRGSAEAGGISLKITLAGDVTEIGQLRNQAEKRWRWYMNGNSQTQSILDATVHGGDKILLRYE